MTFNQGKIIMTFHFKKECVKNLIELEPLSEGEINNEFDGKGPSVIEIINQNNESI